MKYVQFKKWHRSNFSCVPVNMYCPSALKAVSHTHLWLSVCFSSCNKVKWSALHILAVVSADVVASKLKYKYFIKIERKTILLVIHWPESNIWHNTVRQKDYNQKYNYFAYLLRIWTKFTFQRMPRMCFEFLLGYHFSGRVYYTWNQTPDVTSTLVVNGSHQLAVRRYFYV